MRVRKLLDWRKLLIYSHRWLGIVVGVVFVAWCVSGVVLMYARRAASDRRRASDAAAGARPLDGSRHAGRSRCSSSRIVRGGIRISMHGDRPVYRFNTGRVFGRWTLVYADTGEPCRSSRSRRRAGVAARLLSRNSGTLRYDAYLERPDTYTRLPALQTHFPLHRVALDDAAGTEY